MQPSETGVTRRGAVAAFTILPRHLLGGARFKAPSDTLNIAGVGVGGMGASYLRGCETENIAALCDVDESYAAKTFARYPRAKVYRDYRVMLEKEKDIDAVIVGTPDHTHAFVATAAMRLGKHIYCAKPLTRTLFEARQMARVTRETGVATQMSVQSCASEAACATAEWVRGGAIGPVREVHVWTDRPIWPQGLARPEATRPAPPTLDWELWLGPAAARPYDPLYHPFNWRGWVDFGTGAMGDMACHSFHVVFRALDLGHPTAVHACSTVVMEAALDARGFLRARAARFPETFPMSSVVTWDFPARGHLPPVRMHWYEGGLKPPRPVELEPERRLGGDGLLFIGEKGALLSGFSGGPRLLPEARNAAYTPPAKTMRRSTGHYQEWIAAAKGGAPANCPFEFGGLLTEVALTGAVAIRTGRPLAWDAANLRFPNDAEANQYINPPYRGEWRLP